MIICFTRNLLLKQKFSRENKKQIYFDFKLNNQEIKIKEYISLGSGPVS